MSEESKARWGLRDPEEDRASEEREDLMDRPGSQGPRGPKETPGSQGSPDRLGTAARRATEGQ